MIAAVTIRIIVFLSFFLVVIFDDIEEIFTLFYLKNVSWNIRIEWNKKSARSAPIHADTFNTNDAHVLFLLWNDNDYVSIFIIYDNVPARNPNFYHFRLTFAALSLVDDNDNDSIAIDVNDDINSYDIVISFDVKVFP